MRFCFLFLILFSSLSFSREDYGLIEYLESLTEVERYELLKKYMYEEYERGIDILLRRNISAKSGVDWISGFIDDGVIEVNRRISGGYSLIEYSALMGV